MKALSIKFFCISFIAAIALLNSGCDKKSGEPFSGQIGAFKRYPWERFHLTYEYSGDVRGTEELFVSGYGKYEKHLSNYEIISPQGLRTSAKGAITRFIDVYTFDLTQNRCIHQRMDNLDSLYHLEGKDIPTPQEYLETEMTRNYFKNVGTDTLGGKTATRWQQIDGGLTLWVWNCILLRKHIISEDGVYEMNINSIDSLWAVDTSKFIVPQGLPITEASQIHAPDPN